MTVCPCCGGATMVKEGRGLACHDPDCLAYLYVVFPVPPEIPTIQEVDPLSGREYCPRCSSGPRQPADVVECPDCGYPWAGPRLLDTDRVKP